MCNSEEMTRSSAIVDFSKLFTATCLPHLTPAPATGPILQSVINRDTHHLPEPRDTIANPGSANFMAHGSDAGTLAERIDR